MEETQVAVINLKDYTCGIPTRQVHTIIRFANVVKRKQMPDYAEGIVTWKDNDIPVVNLNSRLGLGKSEVTKKTKIIIVNIKERLTGFVVDDVKEVLRYTKDEIEPAPPVFSQYNGTCLSAVGKSGKRLIPVFDFTRFLSEEELRHC